MATSRKAVGMVSAAVCVMISLGLTVTSVSAQGVNLGFETGDFTGWTVSIAPGGDAQVRTSHTTGLGYAYSPVEGTYFAFLEPGGPGNYTTLNQSLALAAGETICGHAAFDAEEDTEYPYNDNAAVRILDSSGTEIAMPWYCDVSMIGARGDGNWTYWEWTAPANGTYILELRVINDIDAGYDSYALFDGCVSGAPVPCIELEKRINGADYVTAGPGDMLEITLWINNCGNVNLTNLSVRDNFPLHKSNAGLSFTGNSSPAADGMVSGINETGWIDFDVLWWGNIPGYSAGHLAPFEPLQPGNNFAITFEATVDELANGPLENCATVTAKYTTVGNVTGTVDDTDCATVSVSSPSGNFITNIELTPPSPATLKLNEYVEITFDYSTNETSGVRIFVRPYTGGSLTPHYAAHGSPLYPVGDSSGSGYFTIQSGAVTVDQLRFQMLDANQSTLLLEFFIPVEYHFVNFDTRGGTYPSIAGTHNGTLTPSSNLKVSKFYTYPCPGTGGHMEYVKIWNNTDWNVTASWNGYTGDWHNLTFNNSFTLYANETYNYTIRTGSYPQIIHESPWNATGGVITCSDFVDINGNRHEGWIPAIRLD